MECYRSYFSVCIVQASGQNHADFFGFSEFIGAFALLAIVFTIADVQYRFRISVSPLPLPKITFWAISVIGFGTLATDVWVAQKWPVIYVPHMTHSAVQGLFATGFLSTAMAWLYVAFLNPPTFSKWNAKKYGQVLFSYLLRGSDSELPIIAAEVGRSSEKLIETYAAYRSEIEEQRRRKISGNKIEQNPGNYASDIMWMIGNRKFCRHVVAASPGTAIRLFQSAEKRKVYDAPIGQFAKNVSSEAIQNPDSNLYHEDSRYQSGLFGELKPFTQAIYGSYRLVEELGARFHSSPLDIDFELARNLTAQQLEAYARAVLATYADRLRKGNWGEHSYSLTRAFDKFKHASWDVYKLDGAEEADPDIRERLITCTRFVVDLIELLEKHENEITVKSFRPDAKGRTPDIYDQVASLMLEIIYNAAGITKPWWPCWDIQHNTVWSQFFNGFRDSKTHRIICFKLRRLIYEEIIDFSKYTELKSFRAARYLGISLNCMGITLGNAAYRDRNTYTLKKAVIRWVKDNYASLHESHPTVAKACLMGSITYNPESRQLIKTYAEYADREPSKEILSLSK